MNSEESHGEVNNGGRLTIYQQRVVNVAGDQDVFIH